MVPISNEKRLLLIAAKKRGEKEEEIAKWLDISKSSVGKIWKRHRDTGDCSPTPYPGRRPILTAEKWEEIKDLVASDPDKTLNEIIEELELPIRKSRLSSLLAKAGHSFKKRQLTQLSKTAKTSKKNGRSSRK